MGRGRNGTVFGVWVGSVMPLMSPPAFSRITSLRFTLLFPPLLLPCPLRDVEFDFAERESQAAAALALNKKQKNDRHDREPHEARPAQIRERVHRAPGELRAAGRLHDFAPSV